MNEIGCGSFKLSCTLCRSMSPCEFVEFVELDRTRNRTRMA